MALFSYKYYNPEVFAAYVKSTSAPSADAILTSGAFANRQDLAQRLKDGVGGNVIDVPMFAGIGGDAQNYDGATNITTTSRDTYNQKMIVVGRAHAWLENDFAYDITGGVDFLATAQEVRRYFAKLDVQTMLSILKGVFSMTGSGNTDFTTYHTTDITSSATAPNVSAVTLNSAIQKASGDNKDSFAIALMHSAVATNLENLGILEYAKYNDADGIQRPTKIAYWNGRVVVVDDRLPATAVAAAGDVEAYTAYTTYILGEGAFQYCDCGAKVPFEAGRNELTLGGQDFIVGRQRKLIAPTGISWAGSSSIISPTDAQLETGSNWAVTPGGNSTVYPHKDIAICRIISKG